MKAKNNKNWMTKSTTIGDVETKKKWRENSGNHHVITSKRGQLFKLYIDLCKSQCLNGTNVGQMLHSDCSCANMVNFISNKKAKALV